MSDKVIQCENDERYCQQVEALARELAEATLNLPAATTFHARLADKLLRLLDGKGE